MSIYRIRLLVDKHTLRVCENDGTHTYWAGSLCSCSLWFPINTRSLSLSNIA